MKDILRNLPSSPGIYKMKNLDGTVVYVGKALNLKKRVTQYFNKNYSHSPRTRKMVEETRDIEVIQTDSELEALILENNLIKDIRPKYNILMKDDKSFVYIKLNLSEDFPRISVIREKELEKEKSAGKARFFGPKLNTANVYETLRIMKKIFPFRQCNLDIKFIGTAKPASVEIGNKTIKYPCLDYSIKQCPGPCIGAISPEEYKKIVQQIENFLSGKNEEIEKTLKEQMMRAAEQKLFEKAARIRDKLNALQQITERQKITDLERKDTDIIGFTANLGRIYFNVMNVRSGKLIDQQNFMVDAFELNENPVDQAEALESFLLQYYQKTFDIPKEILVPNELNSQNTIEKWLAEKRGDKVFLLHPKKGEKNKLLELSVKNAAHFANQHRIKWMASQKSETALQELSEILKLKDNPLKRIEGFDISHLSGTDTCGSMVVFEKGVPKTDHYRHFKMRTVTDKPDDCKSMEEILSRRFKYLNNFDNLTVKKATKKYIPTIKKWGKEVNWSELVQPDIENFYILLHKKEPVGMVRLLDFGHDIFEFSALFIDKKYRGKKLSFILLEKLISKIGSKKARFYIGGEGELIDHYASFGFVPVNNAPDSVQKSNKRWSELAGANYTILAFYKAKMKKDPSFSSKPDLVVVDGGKGQLSAGMKVLKQYELHLPIISLAKKLEEIYVPGLEKPIRLEEGDEALKLLQRIRDESHRFAITFQRDLRIKSMINRQ